MDPGSRRLRLAAWGSLVLLGLATFVWPGELWGLSSLAVWPRPLAAAWLATAAFGLALFVPRTTGARRMRLGFPGRRGALALAVLSTLPFWFLRERTHFSGDGYLLIRDRGHSETVLRAPLLVRTVQAGVRAAESLDMTAETSFALFSVAAGSFAVFCILRLAAALSHDRGDRFLVTALLMTTGSMQLFFGHVEYYAVFASAFLAYSLLVVHALAGRVPSFWTWPAFGLLVPMHLSSLALLPAQAYAGWRARGARRANLLAALASAAAAVGVLRATAPSGVPTVEALLGAGSRYLEPFFRPGSGRHAFGFLSPAHLLAVGNDLLRAAPVAVAAWLTLGGWRRDDPVLRYFTFASAGAVLLSIAFNREVGAFRDWDIFAGFGFAYALVVAARLVRPHPGSQRPAVALVCIAGVATFGPSVATLASTRAGLSHVERIVASPSQWSPFARAYLYEEIAIFRRDRGDAPGALSAYESAVKAHPADARLRTGLGTAYYQSGDLERAVGEFEAAVSRRPDLAAAHNNLAFALVRAGRDLARAREHALIALRLHPQHPDYLCTLASVEIAAGDLDAARAALADVERVAPGKTDATRLRDELLRRGTVP